MRTATVRLPGHPDQACSLVAEAIVDEYVRRDPESRVRLYVTGGRGVMFVAGDVISQSDFDVSALMKRTLGSLGVAEEIEPFISLEHVAAERVAAFRNGSESVITVTGYATHETLELLPAPVALARRVAKTLQAARETDPEWFWLGPDADVTVLASHVKPSRVMVTVEHGAEQLEVVRTRIADRVASDVEGLPVEVNAMGARERRGLAQASGASWITTSPYGSFVPNLPSSIGYDPRAVEKAGAWLARAAAVQMVKSGRAKAALIQATYIPGELRPAVIRARDEQGRDLRDGISTEVMRIDRVMTEWWRPGLNMDAAKWGFAGESGMPWEEEWHSEPRISQ